MNEWVVKYSGPQLSNNQMKSLGWRALKKKVDDLKWVFKDLLSKSPLKNAKIEELGINVRYRSRLDVDNTTATIKIFADALRDKGVIADDDRKVWTSLKIDIDMELKHNEMVFHVYEMAEMNG
jgi:hypothetical protein